MNRFIYLFESPKHTYFSCEKPNDTFKVLTRYKVKNSRAVEYQINPLMTKEQIEKSMTLREIKFEIDDDNTYIKSSGKPWSKSEFDTYIALVTKKTTIQNILDENPEDFYFEKLENLVSDVSRSLENKRISITDLFEIQSILQGKCKICKDKIGVFLLINPIQQCPVCTKCTVKKKIRSNPEIYRKLFPIFGDKTTQFILEYNNIPESIYDLPVFICTYVQLDESLFADNNDYPEIVFRYFVSILPAWDLRLIFLKLFFHLFDLNKSYIKMSDLVGFLKEQKYKVSAQSFIDCIADADIIDLEGKEFFKIFSIGNFGKSDLIFIRKVIDIQRNIFNYFNTDYRNKLEEKEAKKLKTEVKNYWIIDRKLVKINEAPVGVKVEFDIEKFINHNKVVLQGIAGSGKTTMTQMLLNEFKNLGYRVIVLGPTGKSIDVVIKKYKLDIEYSTIHRFLLKSQIGEENTFVLIDESSMIDDFLLNTLIKTLNKPNTRIVVAGDPKQARPVRFGDSFARFDDLSITKKLTVQFRQTGVLYNELFNYILINKKETVDKLIRSITKKAELLGFEIHQKTAGNFVSIREPGTPNVLTYREFDKITDIVHILRKVTHESVDSQNITYRNETRNKLINFMNPDLSVEELAKMKKLPVRKLKKNDKMIFTINKYIDDIKFEYFNGMTAIYVSHDNSSVTTTESTVTYEGVLPITSADVLTIHKMQGSGASKIYLVLNEPKIDYRILYTAMSRTYGELNILVLKQASGKQPDSVYISYDDTSTSYLDFKTGKNKDSGELKEMKWSVQEQLLRIAADLKFKTKKTTEDAIKAIENRDTEYLVWLQSYISENPAPVLNISKNHIEYFMKYINTDF